MKPMTNKNTDNHIEYEKQARLYKALMHPARLAILDVLRYGEHCVCHLEAALGYRQAYISQQLMLLRDAGFIEDRRDGWNIFYRVIRPEIYTVIDAASKLTKDPSKVNSIPDVLANCPCPKCNPDNQTKPDQHMCAPLTPMIENLPIQKDYKNAASSK
jgi:DNA-binding transcriptional ArsR family regulator